MGPCGCRMAYEQVNGSWPADVPPVTPREATTAARRLWRRFMGRPFGGKVKHDPKLRGRSVILAVDPDRRLAMYVGTRHGWRGLVHSMSHRVHARLHGGPNYREHDYRHHWLEKQMVLHVLEQGWLTGRLRPPEKPPAPVRDPAVVKLERVEARAKAWQRKLRRAQTALAKLERQRKRLAA